MSKIKVSIALLVVVLASIIGFYHFSDQQGKTNLKINDTEITVDLAITTDQKTQGLSGRESLSFNQGMLFVYNQPKNVSIWMKDMNFPLDIIWISDKKEIVYIEEKVSPDTHPESFGPSRPVGYVLEVKSGFVEENNLQIGDKVQFEL